MDLLREGMGLAAILSLAVYLWAIYGVPYIYFGEPHFISFFLIKCTSSLLWTLSAIVALTGKEGII